MSTKVDVVYLAGGMRSNWQDQIIQACSNLTFLDPRTHHLTDVAAYTRWDLSSIQASDCVFAYLEKDNPGGQGLLIELGYAKALGKLIIFVDEKSTTDAKQRRYLAMAHEIVDKSFTSLDDALSFLKQYNLIADLP